MPFDSRSKKPFAQAVRWALCACWAAALGRLQAGEQRIVLKEHVNRQWRNELISYSFEAPQGACHVDSIRLDGPQGPVPVQLSDVELWPGEPSVKSARLWLVADLAPLAENVYVVRFGPEPSGEFPVRGDLSVEQTGGTVEMSTSRFGARWRVGGRRARDQVTHERESFEGWRVPGPLEAMRLGDGTWFGGSRLFGDTAVTEWSGRVSAAGPVFAEVTYVYRYEDGTAVEVRARLHAGASGLYWETQAPGSLPDDGFDVVLSAGLPTLSLVGGRGRPGSIPLDTYDRELVAHVSPWADWWDGWSHTTVRLVVGGSGRELHVSSQDPAAWVEPLEEGVMRRWGAWLHKQIPVRRGRHGDLAWRIIDASGADRFTAPEGEIYLRVNHAAGQRKFSVEDRAPAFGEVRRMSRAQVKAEWPPLEEVKDWILSWPPDGQPRPRLFVSPQDMRDGLERLRSDAESAETASRLQDILTREEIRDVPSYKDVQAIEVYLRSGCDAQAAAALRLAERARRHLNALGDFDKMRSTETVAGLFDMIVSTDLVGEEEKEVFRSQMAFLGYVTARASTWNIERGYRSYNPNMSLSYLFARGIVACAIPDHPMAREWVEPGLRRARMWLDEVGPEGEWHESAHYSQVSFLSLAAFAAALRQAGMEDLFLNENLKKWAMWLAQIYTPRDPMPGRFDRRASPPIGRATAGVPWGVFGLMARATVETDPEYSRAMQWAWAETDYNMNTAGHLGGFEAVYMDRTLPMQTPDWKSRLFPSMGPVLRNGVGDVHENYLVLHANRSGGARASELGALMLWFARGVPVAGAFPEGYKERHQLLMSRVIPAMDWQEGEAWNADRYGCATDVEMGEFSALPRQDYFSVRYVHRDWSRGDPRTPENAVSWPPTRGGSGFPLEWTRRLLYLQDDAPGGANYLVLRDTVRGAQPSLWQMWTLSRALVAPQRAAAAAAADDRGAESARAAVRLEPGQRYTAVGQFNVDLEYFVASPADSERWTMRMGHAYRDYGVRGSDYRDLLQLRLEGDGEYAVVMFPRFREETPPEFAVLADGAVFKVQGAFGTDYAFLPEGPTEARAADGVRFGGGGGSVQLRGGARVLSIATAGEAHFGNWGIEAMQAASLRVEDGRLIVDLPHHAAEGGTLTLRTEGRWRLAEPGSGAQLTPVESGFRAVIPAGMTRLELVPDLP